MCWTSLGKDGGVPCSRWADREASNWLPTTISRPSTSASLDVENRSFKNYSGIIQLFVVCRK